MRMRRLIVFMLFFSMCLSILPVSDIHADETHEIEDAIETNEIEDVVESEVESIANSNANENTLNGIIEARLKDNASEPDYSDSWQEYLDGEYVKAAKKFSWNKNTGLTPWSGATASQSGGDPTTEPSQKPTKDVDDNVLVYYGEQLMYALLDTGTNKKIKIMSDIDLAGYDHAWTARVELEGVTIDGNNKIIYNLGAPKSFIDTMKTSTMTNITFDSAKLASANEKMLGIVGNTSDNTKSAGSFLSYVRVQNSLIFSAVSEYDPINGKASYAAPIAESKNLNADHVATSNNVIYALKAHTGGAFGVVEHTEVSNSYSIDSTVIAGGDHSGGFISCSDGAMKIIKSFTNNTVYGNKSTGVFIGAIMPNFNSENLSATFENCFTSGTIEGTDQLGGFIGLIEANTYNLAISFKNCYSTSIVGMRQGGTNLGGFVGSIHNQNGKIYSFENCYAAGEVGAIDIDVSVNRDPSSVGGFIGSFSIASNNTFINCYYDKQTTAMREWATGDASGSAAVPKDGNPGDAGSLDYLEETNKGNNKTGIRGVLTSDSKKFGAGLASLPNANYSDSPVGLPLVNKDIGFTGFTGDNLNTAVTTNTNWIYDGGNTNPNSHNCMYPQLSVFYNSNDTLVRAYSYASVATVHQQVWDDCTHGGPLDRKSYDTVRDLTARFTLTSYVDNGSKDTKVDIVWVKNGVKSNLYGTDQQVIDMFEKINNSKYKREYWTADKFAPGTEWVSVNFTVKGTDGKEVTGTRRLRIIPTSNIEAGNDYLDATVGNTYNHAKDVYFAYSTAKRMAIDLTDLTIGVYPDAFPFQNDDPRFGLQIDWELASGVKINQLFTIYDNEFQVSAEFMSNVKAGIEKPHKDNIINTYVYDVKKFEKVSNSEITEIIYIEDGKTKEESAILTPTKLDALDPVAIDFADKLNGKKPFDEGDQGRYLIEYEWIRTDGRFARDAKMLMVQPRNHEVVIEVKNFDDNSVNDESLKLSSVVFDGGTTRPEPSFGDKTQAYLDNTVEHFKAVDLAFKNVNASAEIKKIQFDITTKDLDSDIKEQTVTIDNVVVDKEFSVPITYYYSSYEEGGKYFAKKVETDRKYVLKKDNDGYFYLTMNNEFIDKETGFTRSDLESDVKVTIYVKDNQVSQKGNVIITNKTFDNGVETNVTDTISYVVKNKDNAIVERFELDSKTNNQTTIRFAVGEYTIERMASDTYNLRAITVDSNAPVTTNHASFIIVKDGDTQIVVQNERKSGAPDPGDPTPDPTPDPKPDPGPVDPTPDPGPVDPTPGPIDPTPDPVDPVPDLVEPSPTPEEPTVPSNPDKSIVDTSDSREFKLILYSCAMAVSFIAITLIILRKKHIID